MLSAVLRTLARVPRTVRVAGVGAGAASAGAAWFEQASCLKVELTQDVADSLLQACLRAELRGKAALCEVAPQVHRRPHSLPLATMRVLIFAPLRAYASAALHAAEL